MSNNKLPVEIEIMDETYKVLYFNNASDVCIMGRYNKLHEVDFWTNEIRVFKDKSTELEIWNRIWKSLITIFINKLHIEEIVEDEIDDRHLRLFAMGIGDALLNNRLLSNREKFPEEVQLFNSLYSLKFYDKPSQVDHVQRNSLFGQVDEWDCTIRIYKGKYSHDGIWQTIWHEIVHAILDKLYLKLSDNETFVDLMATAINGMFVRNVMFRERFKV